MEVFVTIDGQNFGYVQFVIRTHYINALAWKCNATPPAESLPYDACTFFLSAKRCHFATCIIQVLIRLMSPSFSERALHFFSSDSIFLSRFYAHGFFSVWTRQHDPQLVIVEGLSKFIMVAMVFVWTSSSVVMETRINSSWFRFLGIDCFEISNLLLGVAKRVFMVLILLNFQYTSFVAMRLQEFSLRPLSAGRFVGLVCTRLVQNPCLPLGSWKACGRMQWTLTASQIICIRPAHQQRRLHPKMTQRKISWQPQVFLTNIKAIQFLQNNINNHQSIAPVPHIWVARLNERQEKWRRRLKRSCPRSFRLKSISTFGARGCRRRPQNSRVYFWRWWWCFLLSASETLDASSPVLKQYQKLFKFSRRRPSNLWWRSYRFWIILVSRKPIFSKQPYNMAFPWTCHMSLNLKMAPSTLHQIVAINASLAAWLVRDHESMNVEILFSVIGCYWHSALGIGPFFALCSFHFERTSLVELEHFNHFICSFVDALLGSRIDYSKPFKEFRHLPTHVHLPVFSILMCGYVKMPFHPPDQKRRWYTRSGHFISSTAISALKREFNRQDRFWIVHVYCFASMRNVRYCTTMPGSVNMCSLVLGNLLWIIPSNFLKLKSEGWLMQLRKIAKVLLNWIRDCIKEFDDVCFLSDRCRHLIRFKNRLGQFHTK